MQKTFVHLHIPSLSCRRSLLRWTFDRTLKHFNKVVLFAYHRHSPLSSCSTFNRFHLHGYNIYGSNITHDIRRVQSTFHTKLFNKAKVDKVTFLRSLSKLQAEPRTQSRPPQVPGQCSIIMPPSLPYY